MKPDSFRLLMTATALMTVCFAAPANGQDKALENRLKVLERQAKEKREVRRIEAYEALWDMGTEGEAILAKVVRERLDKNLETFEKAIKGGGTIRSGIPRLSAHLEEVRKAALAVIRDSKIYPGENHGRIGQPKVDAAVAKVSEAYDAPGHWILKNVEAAEELFLSLAEDYEWLERVKAPTPPEAPDLDAIIRRSNQAIDTESLGVSESTYKYNVEMRKQNEEGLFSLDDEESTVVRMTNDYRWKMGLCILAADERLIVAARKHSQEMVDLDYFAHDSPVEANRSPSSRARQEGYSGGVAENIAISGSGAGAFRGWYNSSGHHRNMLGGHAHIGVGRAQNRYTQKFGRSGAAVDADGDPTLVYKKKSKSIDQGSADDHAELARWCKSNGLDEEMQFHAEVALAIEFDHAEARKLLGYRKVRGLWEKKETRSAERKTSTKDKPRDFTRQLRDEDPARRVEAIKALVEQEDASPGAIRALLKDSAAEVRAEAARAVAALQDVGSIGALKEALADRNNHTRHSVARALFDLGDGTGIDRLFEDLDSGENNCRISASKVLGGITGQRFGYAWDLTKEDRGAAIRRWKDYWAENGTKVLEQQRAKLSR